MHACMHTLRRSLSAALCACGRTTLIRSLIGFVFCCVANLGCVMVPDSVLNAAGWLVATIACLVRLMIGSALPGPRSPSSDTWPRMMLLTGINGSVQRTSNDDTHLHTFGQKIKAKMKNE